jgi:hypothetical protein
MILAGEDLPAIHHVTEAHLQAVFDETETDFGKFIVLAHNDSSFIQAANVWEMSEECERFFSQKKSEPYCLEYKDENNDTVYAAEGWFTLDEIREAFMQYLRGWEDWKQNNRWSKVEY